MPLLIDFKSGDKLIINGSLIENVGATTKLTIHNESTILREKETLQPDQAQTPASRAYFELQGAYIYPDKALQKESLTHFFARLDEFIEACPKASPIANKIRKFIDDGKLYKALRETQELIRYEANVLQLFNEQLQTFLNDNTDDNAPTDQSKG